MFNATTFQTMSTIQHNINNIRPATRRAQATTTRSTNNNEPVKVSQPTTTTTLLEPTTTTTTTWGKYGSIEQYFTDELKDFLNNTPDTDSQKIALESGIYNILELKQKEL